MLRVFYLSLIGVLFLLISACGGEAATQETDYDTTKKMVVDILQTEDGKKALGEILADEKMQEQLVMDSAAVKQAINETLTSDKAQDMWKKLFEDPKFAEAYYKSIKDNQEKLMKDLMTDAEYQKLMLDLFQNPEMTEQTIQTLKSQQFREHLEKTIQQTLESPLFQAKIQETLLKAAEEQSKSQGGDQGGGDQGEGGSGGGGGSGSGGGS
ncbi:spore germination lipoprotein GerD [Ornithinibacillus contaminans]|uniref:spore germination lipoprotein GerD n=1 Tax=Ornithinibacillus contaminans TaxID=694055 RepID=UPI00064D7655|nr:spore germination lipoprotein GerD [Ornithinibacillus contaminans]